MARDEGKKCRVSRDECKFMCDSEVSGSAEGRIRPKPYGGFRCQVRSVESRVTFPSTPDTRPSLVE